MHRKKRKLKTSWKLRCENGILERVGVEQRYLGEEVYKMESHKILDIATDLPQQAKKQTESRLKRRGFNGRR